MDFSEIRRKVDKHVYRSFDEFEDDFWLIVTNCKAYNKDGSLYYNLATQLGAQVCGTEGVIKPIKLYSFW
jgi:Bromodomain